MRAIFGARRMTISLLAFVLVACSSLPEAEQDEVDSAGALAARASVRSGALLTYRVVRVEVVGVDDAALFLGTAEEWQGALEAAFGDLGVGLAPLPSDPRRAADVVVVVRVRAAPREEEALEGEARANGALLSFLAWSTVPVAPWFVDDVAVDSRVRLEVTSRYEGVAVEGASGLDEPAPVAEDWELPPVETCLWDRQPTASWATVLMILLPPFVFSDADPQHLGARVGPRVRQASAEHVAEVASESYEPNELLREPVLRAGREGAELEFLASEELGRISYRWVGPGTDEGAWTRRAFPRTEGGETRRWRVPLGVLPGAGDSPKEASLRLQVLADHRRGSFRLPYTFDIATATVERDSEP